MSKRRHSRPTARRRAPARAQAAAKSFYRRALRYEPLEDRRLLAVVTVDTLSDTVDFNDGHTSLREAIFATNTVTGADTINFAPSLTASGPAKILLKLGELKNTDALTINGPGASLLTIDASGNDPTPNSKNGDGSRIFNIDDGSLDKVLTVSISGLKLTGGDVLGTGGAIRNRENLTVNRSIISGNATSARAQLPVSYLVGSGGGIFSYRGYLAVSHSVISGNSAIGIGGGVYSKGFGGGRNLSVSYSSIAGNSSASSGGGIASSNSAIANSTISGNSASYDGGGVWGYNVDLSDSTVSGNSAGRDGGGLSGGSGLNLVRSTITKNSAVRSGGGLRADFGATLNHTILAGNMLNGVPHDFTGVMSLEYSLIGVLNGTFSPGDGNIYSFFGPIDPMLGPLADNGGFLLPDGTHILTHALLPGSPVINAGDLNAIAGSNSVPQFDERGTPFSRIVGGRIDIGAFEYQQPTDLKLVVSTLTDESDGDYSPGHLSLREAIQLANMYSGQNYPGLIQTIHFDPALTANGPAKVLLTQGELKITGSMEIDGPGASLLTIDASGNDVTPGNLDGRGSRVFDIDDGTSGTTDVSLSGLSLTGGDVVGMGGAIFSLEKLSVADCTVSGNNTNTGGGGIYTTNDLTIDRSVISGNTAQSRAGGGVYSNPSPSLPATLTISDCTITNNVAAVGEGGGVRKRYGDLTIERSNISNNKAFYAGGGMSIADGTFSVEIADSEITGNSFVTRASLQYGGGIFVTHGTIGVTIERSQVSGNSARAGGGIRDDAVGALTIDSSTIANNTSTVLFAAIEGTQVFITNSTISQNTGGQLAIDFALGTIKYSTITGNASGVVAGSGRGPDKLEIYSSIIVGNLNGDVNGLSNGTISDGYNIIGSGKQVAAFNQPGDQVGVTDAMLGPLADNGGVLLPDGSHILTQALLAGSPAINAGDLSAAAGVNGVPQYDERGTPFGRIFGGRIDIGAFEYQQPSDLNLVVDTLVDEDDGNYSHGDLSLREAIKLANLYPGPNGPSVINTIRFDPALTANGPATILLTMGGLSITHGVNIIGPGANLLTVDASGSDRSPKAGYGINIFGIGGSNQSSAIDVSISGLKLTGGDASVGGAINTSFTNLVVTGMTISGNTALSSGGGIYAFDSNLTVNQSTMSGNVSTSGSGGAIYFADTSPVIHDRKLQIHDSQISNNQAYLGGGGAAVLASTTAAATDEVDIEGSALSGNSLTGRGGSGGGLDVRVTGAPIAVAIANSSFDHNSVGPQGGGGGVSLNNVGATITSSRIESNSGGGGAGGISLIGGRLTQISLPVMNSSIVDCTISGNTSSSQGAGIAFSAGQGTLVLTNDTIINNIISNGNNESSGGGIFAVATNAALKITGSTITGNSAGSGGGIYARLMGSQFTLDGSDIDGNTAAALQSSGAGVDLNGSNSTATIHNSVIENNSATGTNARGGGIFSSVTLSIAGSKISGNTSGRYGGGIYASTGLQIDTSEISGNSALLTKGIGGGVFRTGGGSFTLTNSTVSGNSATMDAGGLYFADGVSNIIDHSTITGNSAARDGGGVIAHTGTLGLVATTVSFNTSGRDGGGVWKTGLLSINGSTINNNTAGGNGGGIAEFGPSNINDTTIGQNTATINGGGIWANDGQNLQSSTILANRAGQAGGGIFLTAGTTAIYDSIVAGDTGPSGADVSGLLGVMLNVHDSLFGSNQGSGLTAAPVGSPDANGNFIGGSTVSSMIVPALGPLTMNGGPTATYAPLAGSVVINAGDPTALAGVNGVPLNDQRGAPFPRVYGGRIDMGAVEAQPNPLPGDFNYNGVVDLADYALYRKALTTLDPRADANGDGRIDDADLAVWRANFGNTYATATASSLAGATKSEVQAPLKMLSNSAAAAPMVSPGTGRISLPIPVQDLAVRPAPTSARTSALEIAFSASQLRTLSPVSRMAKRPSYAPARDAERNAVDRTNDLSASEETVVDEVFTTFGARKSLLANF